MRENGDLVLVKDNTDLQLYKFRSYVIIHLCIVLAVVQTWFLAECKTMFTLFATSNMLRALIILMPWLLCIKLH